MRVENKHRLSAFYPTDLDFVLRNQRIATVVLNSGFTSCRVLDTAFGTNNHN
jgi:nicotinamidase-related amidase